MKYFYLILSVFTASVLASDLDKAPKNFSYGGKKAVFSDFKEVGVQINSDAKAKTTTILASIKFTTKESGFPIFDLTESISGVSLNGKVLKPSDVVEISDPRRSTKFKVVKSEVAANKEHVLLVSFRSSKFKYRNGGVAAGFFMTDLRIGGRGFLEQYLPASFEYDHYKQVITVNIKNSSKSHVLYANGKITEKSKNQFVVSYPDYYTTSSFYFHLTEKGKFVELKRKYKGLKTEIPMTVYSESSLLAARGMRDSLKIMKELESTYGAYIHPYFVAYITSGGGGMEHAGATITSMRALGHEITHFWFARGVMPANGNAGWIDEAIASWRDVGYRRARNGPSGQPHNLGGYTDYRRHTTYMAYSEGRDLISEFDYLFKDYKAGKQKGMKGILNLLFAKYKKLSLTVGEFKVFMEKLTGKNLGKIFSRYVFGNNVEPFHLVQPRPMWIDTSLHPRPFTLKELEDLI